MRQPSATTQNKRDDEIREQISLLLESSGTAATVNLLIALLTYLSIPSHTHTWLWFLIGSSLFRFFLYLLHRKGHIYSISDRIIYGIVLFSITLQGLSWGYASVHLFHFSTDTYRYYLIAIICGMVGGAILTLAPSLLAFFCFALPSTLPFVCALFLEQGDVYTYPGYMGIIFIIAIHVLAQKISSSQREIRKSRRELKKLSEELNIHKERLEILVEKRTSELEKSRENYRQLTEEINNVIFEVNTQGVITYVSPVVTSILGHQPKNLVGRNFVDFVYVDDLKLTQDAFEDILAGDSTTPHDYRLLNSKQVPKWVRSSSRPVIRDNNLVGIRGVLSDIEQEKQAEKEKEELLRRANERQKLEAIGTLAAGIAHDFNNLLMGISGRTSLMLANISPDDVNIEHLQALESYVQSATDLTSQLLGTAQGGKCNPRPIDLGFLVFSSLSMFGRTKKEIEINCTRPESPIISEVDEKQIGQTLLNMYVNAWQAMPNGGRVTVAVSTEVLDNSVCKRYQVIPGDYAKISITDTGTGMDDSTMEMIFDPFFTTKDKHRGTGLGLASAYGIIKNHGGFISVSSEVGHGTTFLVYLPLSKKKAEPVTESENRLIKGSGRILLVDDEMFILDVGKAILKELGYEVVTAPGGREALSFLADHTDGIDLVILDMIMPNMNGSETFDQIRQSHPQLPVILASGYSVDGLAQSILQKGCNDFIQKPFRITELSAKIHRLLDV